jgi:hypothetical protein
MEGLNIPSPPSLTDCSEIAMDWAGMVLFPDALHRMLVVVSRIRLVSSD